MAYVKKSLKVKIAKYEADANRKPLNLSYAPLVDNKYLHLQVGDPENDLIIDSIRVLSAKDGWLIGSLANGAVNKLFEINHIAEGKPNADADKELIEAWQSSGSLFLLDPTGNETLVELATLADGKFLELLDFKALAKLPSEAKDSLTSLVNWQIQNDSTEFDSAWKDYPTFCSYFGKDALYPTVALNLEQITPKRGKIVLPDYSGEFPDKIVLSEIKLPEKGKTQSKGKGSFAGYMPTKQRIEDVLSLLGVGNEQFETLYTLYCENPSKIALALTLTGVSCLLPPQSTTLTSVTLNDNKVLELALTVKELIDSHTALKKECSNLGELSNENLKAILEIDANTTSLEVNQYYLENLHYILCKGYPNREVKAKLKEAGITILLPDLTDEQLAIASETLGKEPF